MKVQDGKPGALGAAQQAGKAAEPPPKAGDKLAGAAVLSFAALMLEGEARAEEGVGKQEAALRGERELSGLLGEREAALVEVSEQSVARREGFGQEQERAATRRAEGDEAQGQADARVELTEQRAQVTEAPRVIEAPAERRGGDEARDGEARPAEGVTGAGAASAEAASVKEAAPTADTARAEEVRRLAERLVESCQAGLDQQGRQVMMLDLQVPGRGCVRVRLRRQGDGVEVRLRADNPALGELLRARSGELRDGMAGRGVAISRLEVAS
jgi:hypothetical protein